VSFLSDLNALDWILVVLVLAYALSGYWQGFVTGAFATGGLLLGGLFGVWVAPKALGDADPSLWVSLGALFIVILAASLGQGVMQYVGSKVRDQITWQPARVLDACGGAVLSAVAVLLVAWALGVAIAGARIGGVSETVRSSAVLGEVDRVLPSQANDALGAFNKVVGASFFPQYLEPFAPERIVEVGPGPRRLLNDQDVVDAAHSVLKVRGSNDCGRGVEGTGFVIGERYLMTNAHVVAGVDSPTVEIGGSESPASVVLYDPDMDIAVLRIPAGVPALEFAAQAEPRDGVAILGYPEDGPYNAQPGRIRSEQRLRSPDIYGEGSVIREVYALRGLIRPGNSGGPIVDADGDVAGVVFAASVTDDDTGYALTADEVTELAEQAAGRTSAVDTGPCAG